MFKLIIIVLCTAINSIQFFMLNLNSRLNKAQIETDSFLKLKLLYMEENTAYQSTCFFRLWNFETFDRCLFLLVFSKKYWSTWIDISRITKQKPRGERCYDSVLLLLLLYQNVSHSRKNAIFPWNFGLKTQIECDTRYLLSILLYASSAFPYAFQYSRTCWEP